MSAHASYLTTSAEEDDDSSAYTITVSQVVDRSNNNDSTSADYDWDEADEEEEQPQQSDEADADADDDSAITRQALFAHFTRSHSLPITQQQEEEEEEEERLHEEENIEPEVEVEEEEEEQLQQHQQPLQQSQHSLQTNYPHNSTHTPFAHSQQLHASDLHEENEYHDPDAALEEEYARRFAVQSSTRASAHDRLSSLLHTPPPAPNRREGDERLRKIEERYHTIEGFLRGTHTKQEQSTINAFTTLQFETKEESVPATENSAVSSTQQSPSTIPSTSTSTDARSSFLNSLRRLTLLRTDAKLAGVHHIKTRYNSGSGARSRQQTVNASSSVHSSSSLAFLMRSSLASNTAVASPSPSSSPSAVPSSTTTTTTHIHPSLGSSTAPTTLRKLLLTQQRYLAAQGKGDVSVHVRKEEEKEEMISSLWMRARNEVTQAAQQQKQQQPQQQSSPPILHSSSSSHPVSSLSSSSSPLTLAPLTPSSLEQRLHELHQQKLQLEENQRRLEESMKVEQQQQMSGKDGKEQKEEVKSSLQQQSYDSSYPLPSLSSEEFYFYSSDPSSILEEQRHDAELEARRLREHTDLEHVRQQNRLMQQQTELIEKNEKAMRRLVELQKKAVMLSPVVFSPQQQQPLYQQQHPPQPIFNASPSRPQPSTSLLHSIQSDLNDSELAWKEIDIVLDQAVASKAVPNVVVPQRKDENSRQNEKQKEEAKELHSASMPSATTSATVEAINTSAPQPQIVVHVHNHIAPAAAATAPSSSTSRTPVVEDDVAEGIEYQTTEKILPPTKKSVKKLSNAIMTTTPLLRHLHKQQQQQLISRSNSVQEEKDRSSSPTTMRRAAAAEATARSKSTMASSSLLSSQTSFPPPRRSPPHTSSYLDHFLHQKQSHLAVLHDLQQVEAQAREQERQGWQEEMMHMRREREERKTVQKLEREERKYEQQIRAQVNNVPPRQAAVLRASPIASQQPSVLHHSQPLHSSSPQHHAQPLSYATPTLYSTGARIVSTPAVPVPQPHPFPPPSSLLSQHAMPLSTHFIIDNPIDSHLNDNDDDTDAHHFSSLLTNDRTRRHALWSASQQQIEMETRERVQREMREEDDRRKERELDEKKKHARLQREAELQAQRDISSSKAHTLQLDSHLSRSTLNLLEERTSVLSSLTEQKLRFAQQAAFRKEQEERMRKVKEKELELRKRDQELRRLKEYESLLHHDLDTHEQQTQARAATAQKDSDRETELRRTIETEVKSRFEQMQEVQKEQEEVRRVREEKRREVEERERKEMWRKEQEIEKQRFHLQQEEQERKEFALRHQRQLEHELQLKEQEQKRVADIAVVLAVVPPATPPHPSASSSLDHLHLNPSPSPQQNHTPIPPAAQRSSVIDEPYQPILRVAVSPAIPTTKSRDISTPQLIVRDVTPQPLLPQPLIPQPVAPVTPEPGVRSNGATLSVHPPLPILHTSTTPLLPSASNPRTTHNHASDSVSTSSVSGSVWHSVNPRDLDDSYATSEDDSSSGVTPKQQRREMKVATSYSIVTPTVTTPQVGPSNLSASSSSPLVVNRNVTPTPPIRTYQQQRGEATGLDTDEFDALLREVEETNWLP